MARLALSVLSCFFLTQTSHQLSVYHQPTGFSQNYSAEFEPFSYTSYSSLFNAPHFSFETSYPSAFDAGDYNLFPGPNSLGKSSSLPFRNFIPRPPRPVSKTSCEAVRTPRCTLSKYRTIDGSCNNIKYPSLGIANSTYARLLPPKYSDGIHAPPKSVKGGELPLSRLVSTTLFPNLPINDPVWTLITMTWGQILTHDMAFALGTTQGKYQQKRCCSEDGHLGQPSPSCFPIIIPENDHVFKHHKRDCMNFVRSATDIDTGCNSGKEPAEQMVSVTHWMDASFIYGSTDELAQSLREGTGGKLKTEIRHYQQWPPQAQNKSTLCDGQKPDGVCYQFGDARGNQNPQLTVLQILFLREHNRLAGLLAKINPHWDDETLYQEARRIVIAEYQHINYYEYLPILLGAENMLKYGLIKHVLPSHNGYVNDYNDYVEPNTSNEHATASFRYIHSAIQGYFYLFDEYRKGLGSVRLSDVFNRPDMIEQGDNMASLTRGLSTQSEEQVDEFFTSEITNYLFRNGKPFGRDLRAIDFQRGRDHGLAGYNDARHYCGLPKAHSFQDFKDYIEPQKIEKLASLYAHPDDVDLSVGGSLEDHCENTLFGPTFLCLTLEQFYRTRIADRFFYEQGDSPNTFTPAQLTQIRRASLARLFCDNSDHVRRMQPKAFQKISDFNQLVSCDDYNHIPVLNLNYWKQQRKHHNHGPWCSH